MGNHLFVESYFIVYFICPSFNVQKKHQNSMKEIYKYLNFFVFTSICFGCGGDFDLNEKNDKLFSIVPPEYSDLIFENIVEQTRENNHLINVEFVSGGGVAVGDINNDGLQDIFFTGNQVSDKLYLNKGGLKFEDISGKAGILDDKKWSTGVTFVDIDNDGDQDIYVCRMTYLENDKSANQLYINNGNLTFSEMADQFGIADKGFSTQAVFFDFDKDNLLDLYIVNQPPSIPGKRGKISRAELPKIVFSDRMYKNIGSGKFADITEEANVRNFAFGLSATVGDFNNDSWPDIYVANDFDVADHLYINQQDGTFQDMLQASTGHISTYSMGSDVADYDNDGLLDILVVDMVPENHKRLKTHMGGMNPKDFWNVVDNGGYYQYMFNTLQRNNGNGTFGELAQLAGVTSTDWSWAPLFADFNNDGFKDIFVTNGILSNNLQSDLSNLYDRKVDSLRKVAINKNMDPDKLIDVTSFMDLAPTDKLPNYIYQNNGDLTFTKKIEEWGMELPTLSNGAAYADFDLDGDLDLVINNLQENAYLYKNNSTENGWNNYVRFQLIPEKGQVLYGSKVSLYQNDTLRQLVELTNTRGFRSKSEDVVHFGIGKMNHVDKVVVEWPNRMTSTQENLAANKLYTIDQKNAVPSQNPEPEKNRLMFHDVAASLQLDQVFHQENNFDDYVREVLLPHNMSQFGPPIGVADVNGDGREDFYLGGSAGYSGTLYMQNSHGKFEAFHNGAWTQDKASEDMGVAFVDVDGDKDLDMVVASGGNEFSEGDAALQDRLYINDGLGHFKKDIHGFPAYLTSSGCVRAHDFDKDGDMDLFIGGRMVPGKYPLPANSHLLENKGGNFVEVTEAIAPDLYNLGMVTAASWTDYNKDGLDDLVIVGEWMPVTIFSQSADGHFQKQILPGLENSEGWYYSVIAEDMDGDGDEDLVVGNLGLNYKYKSSLDGPFEVFSGDFDDNGNLDIVLSYYEHGEMFPVRGKSCSTQQMPSLSKKFDTYEKFGSSNLQEVYGEPLESALNLKAKTFASAYIENLGNGSFQILPLPNLAQVSSVNAILAQDFDLDGNKDLLIIGNLYQSEVETPRNDAGTGLLLIGNGSGEFYPMPVYESGFCAPNDAKDMKKIMVDGSEVILVANNSNLLQAIEYKPIDIKNKASKIHAHIN